MSVGFVPVTTPGVEALTRDRLHHVDQNYARFETIAAANVPLVEAQAEIELAQAWGGGLVASVDGLRAQLRSSRAVGRRGFLTVRGRLQRDEPPWIGPSKPQPLLSTEPPSASPAPSCAAGPASAPRARVRSPVLAHGRPAPSPLARISAQEVRRNLDGPGVVAAGWVTCR